MGTRCDFRWCPHLYWVFTARLQEAAEKLAAVTECDHGGLKPAPILGALRGAEAPLFHGAARARDTVLHALFHGACTRLWHGIHAFVGFSAAPGSVPFPDPF